MTIQPNRTHHGDGPHRAPGSPAGDGAPREQHGTPPLLRLDAVCHCGKYSELAPLDLVIEAGARHGVIGADPGAGPALLALIAGTTTARSGHITVDGRPVNGLSAARRARLGIVVASRRSGIAGHLTVEQNLYLAVQRRTALLRSRGALTAGDSRVIRVSAALARTGLTPHAQTLPGQLSAVRTRLLALAIALAGSPRLLLINDLAAGLDAAQLRQLAATLEALPGDLAILVADRGPAWVHAVTGAVTVLRQRIITGPAWCPSPHPPSHAAVAGRPEGEPPMLTLERVTASTETSAVTNLNLSVPARGVHALLGHPGSGKTLLLNVIAGLHQPRADAVICFAGAEVTPGCAQQAASRGIILVGAGRLTAHRTVGEHLAYAERRHRPADAHRWTIPAVLSVFPRLNEVGSCYPHQLGGLGRVALGIGVALLSHPRLLLLDDPGRDLAAADRAAVAAAITVIARQGVTVLVAESEPVLTPATATQVSILSGGAIVSGAPTGKPVDLAADPDPGRTV